MQKRGSSVHFGASVTDCLLVVGGKKSCHFSFIKTCKKPIWALVRQFIPRYLNPGEIVCTYLNNVNTILNEEFLPGYSEG